MKKITLMMSLLLSLGSMTTSAQVLDRTGWSISVSGETASDGGGKNAIIDGDNNSFWHSNWGGTGASGDASKKLPQFFQVDLGAEQTFRSIMYVPRVNLNNGTVFSFKVYVSNTAFPSTANGTSAANIVAGLNADDLKMQGTFDYTGKSGQPTMVWSADQDVTGQYVLFVITDAQGNNQGEWASCAEFNLSKDNFKVTYNYNCEGEVVGQKVAYTQTPEENVPSLEDYTNGSTITKTEDGIYTVECIPHFFESAATYDPETAHWYAIDIHNNQANKLWYVANEGGLVTTPTIEKGKVTNLTDNYLWTFVGDYTKGYKIYNKATGKAIAYTTNATTSDEGEVFQLKASTAYNKAKGFCFTKDGSNYLNEQGDKILTWNKKDEGSTMHVQEPKDYVLAYAAPLSIYDDNGAPEGAIGANSYLKDATNLAKFKEAYAAATANNATAEQVQALAEENVKVDAGKGETIVAGKYYRLVNAASSKTLYVTADNIMQTSNEVNKAVSSVVTFADAEAGRYRIKMQDKTFGKRVGDNQAITLENEDSGNKGSYKVVQVGTHFAFYDMVSNVSNRSYLHCNAGAANTLFTWEAGAINSASRWFVIPATDVEIAMTEVNGERYASAYLPFAVNAVNDAQAYVGELNNAKNVLNMTAVSSVPANQGFVLVGNQEKATLTIGEAATLPIANNALTGSNVKVTLNDDNRADNLVFGKSSEGIVGFYKPATALTTIAANKAFIAASSLTTGAGAIAMNFGGNTTGINNAVVASENAPIFDLSGRRVVKAVKGGVYIQNGKKFVK